MDIVLRGIVVFFFLYVLMRVIGRRELSSLEPFDLILLVILGDAVQQGLTQDDYSLTGALLAIGTIAVLQVGVSYANFRFPRLRPLLDGEPIVVVQDGKPIEKNLRRERMTLDDLAAAARSRASRTLDDVAVGRDGDERRDQLHQEVRRRDAPPHRGAGRASCCRRRTRSRRSRRASSGWRAAPSRTGRATGSASRAARSR